MVAAELIAVLGLALFAAMGYVQARSESRRLAAREAGRPALRVVNGRRVA
ncbi:MAG: hypothetical protein K6U79_04865 [Firmicutes bacterium]|nr:hypothetical protein [Bacillota bacterium]